MNTIFSIANGQLILRVPAERIYSREGQAYVRRLLDPTIPSQVYKCRKIYKMRQHVFQNFCNLLRMERLIRDTMNITVEEQLAMFLVTVGQNQRYGVTRERFHRSTWTVNIYFNKMLNAILQLSRSLLVNHSSTTHARIKNDPNVFPYFKVFLIVF